MAVDGTGEIIGKFNDQFREAVGRRRPAGEEERSRRHVEAGVFAQAVVENNNAQRVEQLALVFVDALDLAVKDYVGINGLARGRFQPIGELYIRLAFGVVERVAEGFEGRRRRARPARRGSMLCTGRSGS